MQIIADLHLHSKYSRAVSPEMILPKMAGWAVKKGIGLLGTADWTHPLWLREIKANLEEVAPGLYGLKKPAANSFDPGSSLGSNDPGSLSGGRSPLFILSTEISSIYSQNGKGHRIHNVVLAPSIEIVEKINQTLVNHGANLMSDGRPITGIPATDLVKMILGVDERCLIIPAHIWTPWFSLYGSQSGFDSIDECFGDMAKYIYAVETGLSSDPAMNWRIAELDKRSIVSNSDAHSGPKLGREATVFELQELSYSTVREAIIPSIKYKVESIKQKNEKNTLNTEYLIPNTISHTLEFYPEEGKYHYTGHRACGVKQTPEETRRLGETCSVCGKHLTVGVMHRVDELAVSGERLAVSEKIDENGVKWISQIRPIGQIDGHPPYAMLVPLQEIIAESLESVPTSIKVQIEYEKLRAAFAESSGLRLGEASLRPGEAGEPKGEFGILLTADLEEIAKISGEKVAEGIKKVRSGDIVVDPGYDGVFGVVKIWPSSAEATAGQGMDKDPNGQMKMF